MNRSVPPLTKTENNPLKNRPPNNSTRITHEQEKGVLGVGSHHVV